MSEFLIKSYRKGKNTKIILSMLQSFQHSSLSAVAVVNHGAIIRTGIALKKIRCYMHDSACRRLIAENAKIF